MPSCHPKGLLVASLLLVAVPFVPSSFLLLVVRPGASSVHCGCLAMILVLYIFDALAVNYRAVHSRIIIKTSVFLTVLLRQTYGMPRSRC